MIGLVLIGGIPGSGKTWLIDFLVRNSLTFGLSSCCNGNYSYGSENFEQKNLKGSVAVEVASTVSACQQPSDVIEEDRISNGEFPLQYYVISYDDICSIPEQKQLIEVNNGWKNYRREILEAAECFLCDLCEINTNLPKKFSSETAVILKILKNKYSNSVKEKNKVFLIEDNFYYRSMRYEWFQIARKYSIGFAQVYLNCHIDIALQRNKCRNYSIPEEVINFMSSKVEFPDPGKNKWEKNSMMLDTSRTDVDEMINKVIQIIRSSMKDPVMPMHDCSVQKRESQLICSKNVIHQVDQILRKLTAKIILQEKGNKNKEELKSLSCKINSMRQQLLLDIKQGSVVLPQNIMEAIANNGVDCIFYELENLLLMLLKMRLM